MPRIIHLTQALQSLVFSHSSAASLFKFLYVSDAFFAAVIRALSHKDTVIITSVSVLDFFVHLVSLSSSVFSQVSLFILDFPPCCFSSIQISFFQDIPHAKIYFCYFNNVPAALVSQSITMTITDFPVSNIPSNEYLNIKVSKYSNHDEVLFLLDNVANTRFLDISFVDIDNALLNRYRNCLSKLKMCGLRLSSYDSDIGLVLSGANLNDVTCLNTLYIPELLLQSTNQLKLKYLRLDLVECFDQSLNFNVFVNLDSLYLDNVDVTTSIVFPSHLNFFGYSPLHDLHNLSIFQNLPSTLLHLVLGSIKIENIRISNYLPYLRTLTLESCSFSPNCLTNLKYLKYFNYRYSNCSHCTAICELCYDDIVLELNAITVTNQKVLKTESIFNEVSILQHLTLFH
ncbi:hypothetical protein GEMRC1_012723 [Eukaryota sp. GEM-RC1]